MNINLSAVTAKKQNKQGSVQFGLNRRGTNVLGADEASSDEEGRDAVNQAISNEQAALKERAKQATLGDDPTIYDYDEAYDSFRPKETPEPTIEDKKSRYIGDLLKAAKERERERDIIRERKIAREQEAEEEDLDVRGKERFVTAAYKRKLEEREIWKKEDEKRQREEEENDVTKKDGEAAMMNFYGKLNRNVALGGSHNEETKDIVPKSTSDGENVIRTADNGADGEDAGFLEGFERAETNEEIVDKSERNDVNDQAETTASRRERQRKEREEKVEKARLRYFARHGITG